MIGSHPRDTFIDQTARTRIRSSKRGQWEGAVGVPVLLVDGVVSGVWGRVERRGKLEITVRPAVRITTAQRRATEREATRIATFLDRPATVTFA